VTAIVRPVRLQLSRKLGFDLQALSLATNGLPAVVVTRASRKWGNPFTIANAIETGYATAETAQAFVVECFDDWLGPTKGRRDWWQGPESDRRRADILKSLEELRGKNIACVCGLGIPCHGDIYLARANPIICEGVDAS
jgi:hypothetical protein